jgi:glucose/arabinose dehydrogenase
LTKDFINFMIMKKFIVALFLLAGLSLWSQEEKSLPLDRIRLPEGFHIEIYADGVENARAMAFAEDTTLFVGSRRVGKVYAVKPDKEVVVIDEGLQLPTGIEYYKGDLYVSEVSRILKYENILETFESNPEPTVINEDLPTETWHGWKFIKVGPDEKLYVPVGAPCNVCDSANIIYATICRMNLDGSELEIYAEGVRNTVGFDWEPSTGVLWFTDNGRDWMGDDQPPDELNKALTHGMHFGFPYLHGKGTKDPEFWDKRPREVALIIPAKELPAHVAALGMRFYDGDMFPEEYQGGIFIAEHGSWNRSEKIGYRVTFASLDRGAVYSYSTFAGGWMKNETAWGRPADVEIAPDGSLLVSDDFADCIYRIYYDSEE